MKYDNCEELANQACRLPRFQTRTFVSNCGSKRMVKKVACSDEALPFLKAIAAREAANARFLGKEFDVLCGHLENDVLEYEYLPFPSLAELITNHLRKREPDMANQLYKQYVTKICRLDSIQIAPEAFLHEIVGSTESTLPEVECLSRGLVDLTPRNILVDRARWIVIDNEWSFDFPVPMAFLLFRALMSMSLKLQPEIRVNTNPTNEAVKLFRGRFRSFYCPRVWIEKIIGLEVELDDLFLWERAFQKYVMGSECFPFQISPGTGSQLYRRFAFRNFWIWKMTRAARKGN